MNLRRTVLRITRQLCLIPLGLLLAHAAFAAPPRPAEVIANPEPQPYGENTTLTAYLIDPTSTGTMTFSVDGNMVGSATVAAGTASIMVTAPTWAVGSHTLTAVYSGDASHSPLTLSSTHTVTPLDSTSIMTVTTPIIYYGQTADGTGSVDATQVYGNATVDGGTITFYLDNVNVCVLTVQAGGSSCPPSVGQGLQVGTHQIYCVYSGNQYYSGSTSNTGTIQVLPDVTTTNVTSSLNPSYFGQTVNFTVATTALYATPQGTVSLYDGATLLTTATLGASGSVAVPVSTLAVGTHNITAQYNASTDFQGSGSAPPLQQVVNAALATSVTALTSSVNPSNLGQSVTFTATVVAGGTTPTGTVTFYDGGTALLSVPLNAAGVATYATSSLTLGTHTITAAYAGSSTVAASTSAPLTQIVQIAPNYGFTLTVAPSTFTVGAGNFISLVATVTETGGFSAPVQLSCSGQPAETACNFGSATIPAGGGVTNIAISPSAAHFCGSSSPLFIAGAGGLRTPLALAFTTLFGLLFTLRSRKLLRALGAVAVLAMLTGIGGCGSGCTDFGVRPGTYSFNIVATTNAAPVTTTFASTVSAPVVMTVSITK